MSIVDHKINPNLRLSYWMGLFRCYMVGFCQDFFTPFLLLLGGSDRQVGIMVSSSNIFSSIFQTASAEATAKMASRKKVVSLACLLQAVSLLFMMRIVFSGSVAPAAFIIPVVLFNICGAFVNPGWFSILSDMVRPNRWGTYFGWRNRNLGLVTVGSTFCAGLVLFAMSPVNKRLGFGIIFTIAFVFELLAWFALRRVGEPKLETSQEDHFSFYKFIRRYRASNFVRFTFFVAAVNFSVNLAAPYFPVLMLRDLKFNYLLFSAASTLTALTLYVSIHRWGQHADRVGNLKIIKLISPLFCISPFLWIINQSPFFVIPVEMFSGFLWAGFNLCTANFILDAVTPAKRTRCYAYYTFITGAGLAAGAVCGGFLIRYLPPLFHYKILTLFLISGVLRLAVGLSLPRTIKEVRVVDKISSRRLFLNMIGIN